MIRDWLTLEGGAKGDPTQWIDAISKETHGWPQHVTAYGDAAAKQIKKDQGAMTNEGLKVVYQAGMRRRMAYYKQRVAGIGGDALICLFEAIMEVGLGESLFISPPELIFNL